MHLFPPTNQSDCFRYFSVYSGYHLWHGDGSTCWSSTQLLQSLRKICGQDYWHHLSQESNCYFNISPSFFFIWHQFNEKVLKFELTIWKFRVMSPWLWPDLLFNIHPHGFQLRKCLKILHNFSRSVIDRKIRFVFNELINISEKSWFIWHVHKANYWVPFGSPTQH